MLFSFNFVLFCYEDGDVSFGIGLVGNAGRVEYFIFVWRIWGSFVGYWLFLFFFEVIDIEDVMNIKELWVSFFLG